LTKAFFFSVNEDGSYHELEFYRTEKECIAASKKYLKSRDGRYAHADILKINEVNEFV